ncbi:uncharacterized protein LOC143178290 isoform X2 [Calliopsis andreniformis]|uniref:uncharacterized protein LOC143178290 isoform X2 n=1 Tax=Calliopsis andreniformis TaxID=337506 RepID=UPI003FCCCD63
MRKSTVKDNQKYENVETTIRALLLSRKGSCTLTQLSKDYYETEGEPIPSCDLGYRSLLHLLQSMPKSVMIECRNQIYYVKGIASEKTKHVSKLVAGQKDQKFPVGRKSFKPSHYYPVTVPQKVHIPAELLTMVITLVNDHPDGLNKDYILQAIHSHMPFTNISMSDMEEQLHKLSHKIYQTHNKIYPIESKQRNFNSKPPIVTASGEEDSEDILDYEDDDFNFVSSSQVTHLPDTKTATKTKPTSSFIKDTVSKCHDQNIENTISKHKSKEQPDQINSLNLHNYKCNDQSQAETQIEFNNNVEKENYFDGKNVDILINERVRFRLEKLIQNHPNGIWCAELPEKYLEEYKVSLNYTELGFNSVREFASQLPQIFHCIQPNDTGDFMLYSAKTELPLNKPKDKQKTINLAELHHIYERDDETEALPTTLSIDTCKKLIPDGIVTIGECVGQINVEDLVVNEKPYIEVVVVEVFTPSFFWIQLRKKQKIFKTFMDDLHEFYSRKSEEYVIPPVVLEKGLNCACIYNGIWHRGIIKTVKPDLQVTVMFYDYGTLKTYPPDAIFYLHRMFSSIPAQAIPCGLINTKPYKGSKWSRSATHHFAVRTSQSPLVATIASINKEDNSLMVTLTDTLEDEDVHINDWLVEQKLAQHGKMGDKVDMSDLLLYVEENLIYSPEQCYEEETQESESEQKTMESIAPLVSPQSTLNNKVFNFSSELSLSEESQKLSTIVEENLQNQVPNNLSSTSFSLININTNPLLQDKSTYNDTKDELTPEKFMELWNENLKLQMQITATFHMLFNKVMKNSQKSTNGESDKDNKLYETMNNMFMCTRKGMETLVNFGAVNDFNTKSSDTNNDFMKSDYSCGNPVFPTINQQQPLHNFTDNGYVNNQANLFENTAQKSASHLNSTYTNYFIPMDNNVDAANQHFVNKQSARNESYPSQFGKFNTGFNIDNSMSAERSDSNETPFKETNPFRLSLSGKLQISDSDEEVTCLNSNTVSAAQNDQRSIFEHNPMTFQEDKTPSISKSLSEEISFNFNQHLFTYGSSNMNNINDDISRLNTQSQPVNYTWGIDNITNNMSKFTIDNPFLTNDIDQTAKTEDYTPYFTMNSQKHVEKQNTGENIFNSCSSQLNDSFLNHKKQFIAKTNKAMQIDTNNTANFNPYSFTNSNNFTLLNGNYNCRNINDNYVSSSWLPINSSPSSKLIDNTNVDEGYLTRPSTSHNSYRSSPLVQANSEVEYSQESLNRNPGEPCNIPTRMWMKSIDEINTVQSELWRKHFPSQKNEYTEALYDGSNQNTVENVSAKETTHVKQTGTHVNVNDTKVINNLYLKENEFKNAGYMQRVDSVRNHLSLNNCLYDNIFFHPVVLPNCVIHTFYYKEEGWILIDEFIKTFTEFETVQYMMNFLHILHIPISIQEIDKNQYSINVLNMDGVFLEETNFVMYESKNLQLMPLKTMLKLLYKLKILSRQEIDCALQQQVQEQVVTGLHTFILSSVIHAYGRFKHYIDKINS